MRRITRMPILPARPRAGHKGIFGKVLIIGGSEGMVGAPSFAAMAALRMGCGLAYVATDPDLLHFVLSVVPEAVGVAVRTGRDARFLELVRSANAVVCGPGLGQSPLAVRLLGAAIGSPAPLLLDADALNLIAAGKVRLARAANSTVLTPHPGEMQRLGRLFAVREVPEGDAGRVRVAAAAARHFKQVVLLKGERTVICDGQRYAISSTGDSTLSKAGSGDILSGMIGTLLGQQLSTFDAAWLGAHYHGLAGEYAGREVGRRSALAREIVDALPFALEGDRDYRR